MCGIFGSTDLERFKTLYQLNKDRGSFAYGTMLLQEREKPDIQKSQGDCLHIESTDAQYYMGHTQGPTSAQRDFNPETSHPFTYHAWSVAHNGVLSNSKLLAEKYKVDNPVDTAVIPVIIWNKFTELYHPDIWVWEREIKAIKLACEELEGTFSCWIHNSDTNNVYLVRCGSTLFYSQDGDISSKKPDDSWATIKEGDIYKLEETNFTPVGEFKNSSPFFIL